MDSIYYKQLGDETNEMLTVYLKRLKNYVHITQIRSFGSKEVLLVNIDSQALV